MISATIESTSVEQWRVTVKLTDDPDPDVPEFQITASGAADPESDAWKDGTWSTAWSTTTNTAVALTPTIGAATATLPVGAASPVELWCRVGTVIVRVARITVR